jgi:hypothetical protein
MGTTAQRLIEAMHTMPDSLLAQVLDFAEFLQTKSNERPPTSVLPLTLAELMGGLAHSASFQADPLAIQARLHDEWH